MKKIKIVGGKKLSGEITIGGAKNSAVALMPASLLADGPCEIKNVPDISDRDALFEIIRLLDVKVEIEKDVVRIDSTNMNNKLIPEDLSHKLRASYYFIGVLLAKYKYVEVFFPGGCNIGSRPINLHLSGFEALGATITHCEENHKYIIKADELIGTTINLGFASVGATINIMFAATKAKGITIIKNAAKEPEIINIADYLNLMGAKIKGAGTSEIIIEGVKKMHAANISVLPDRIEAGTYVLIGALLGENLRIVDFEAKTNEALLSKLKDMGIKYHIDEKGLIISKTDNFKPINIKTLVYPGFPTDLGQPMTVLLTQANGKSYFEETIWENRMQHIPYLTDMGANIELVDNNHLIITGKTKLKGGRVNATDLRGGGALVVAGLIAEGTTIISDIEHILRGYEKIISKLKKIGAQIEFIEED
ncbi:MAG: UDP-N-acetylglucosamine 1-carboxyvinyltransferase [Mollicutes bacterium]|nr:UDP-N-acetylglucosamine 1-carboxyvinyltransferase [Mollicutes bacterium]